MKMRKLKLVVTMVFVGAMLVNGVAYGQNKGASKSKAPQPSDVVAPSSSLDVDKEVEQLKKDGWVSEKYDIADMLNSSYKMMCAMSNGGVNQNVWVRSTANSTSLKEVRQVAFMKNAERLSNLVKNEFMINLYLCMDKQSVGPNVLRQLEMAIQQSVIVVVQNNMQKTFEVYKESDDNFMLQTIYMVNYSKMLKSLETEISKNIANVPESEKAKDLVTKVVKKMSQR